MASKQLFLYAGLFVWLVLLWYLVVSYRENWVIMVATALLASPLLLLALRLWLEEGRPAGLFSPSSQSWAFLFGDILWLPLAFGASAYGYQFVPADSWFKTSVWWLAICVAIGIAAGLVFHMLDSGAYSNAGYELALVSPTKLAHDFVSYPLLFGGLLFLGVPVLAHQFMWAGAVALTGVLLWTAMGVKDMIDPPHPGNLHPKWSCKEFQIIN